MIIIIKKNKVFVDCDNLIDSDYDGISDENDLCEGYDDSIDIDNDAIPDNCDQLIDSDSDGVVDYSSATMIIEQVEKGTSVVRIEAEMAPLAAYQAYVTAYQQWDDDYVSRTIDEFGDLQTTIADGAPAEPQAPAPWVEQSGEITLEWFDDNFV